MTFTAMDGVVAIILACSVIVSLVRGFTREILSLIAWILSFVIATRYADEAAALLPADWTSPALRLAVGFGALLLGVRLLGSLVTWAIDIAIRATGLTLADRGLGSLFGLARGCVIVMALAVIAGLTQLPRQPVWQNAFSAPWIVLGVQTVKPLLPEKLAGYVRF
jgi:membrane protein required for colicin V production